MTETTLLTWTRPGPHGTLIFRATQDPRGNITLTREELDGLMRTGGWTAAH